MYFEEREVDNRINEGNQKRAERDSQDFEYRWVTRGGADTGKTGKEQVEKGIVKEISK